MRKRQSHWLPLTYYCPCFDFSESVQANADYVINIHEPSSSIRGSLVILSALFVVSPPPLFIETLNDKQYLNHKQS